jgi:uncharacterized protein (TIRG00374 family)
MVLLFKNINILYLILLLALITADRILMAYKWHLLLKVRDIGVSLTGAIRIYYIATFVGFFLPTTVGGDIVRIIKIRSEKHKGADALSSVVLERMLGFIASAIFASAAALLLVFYLKLNVWNFFLIAGAVLLIFTSIVLVMFNGRVAGKIESNKRLSENFILNKLLGAYKSYLQYRRHKKTLVMFFVLSMIEQMAPVIGNYLAGMALNLKIPFIYFLLIMPVIQLITRIPVSFEGLGVTEGLLVYFFLLLGLSKTDAFSVGLLGHIAVIVATLPALFFYIRDIKTSFLQNR